MNKLSIIVAAALLTFSVSDSAHAGSKQQPKITGQQAPTATHTRHTPQQVHSGQAAISSRLFARPPPNPTP